MNEIRSFLQTTARRMVRSAPQWGISLAAHSLVFIVLAGMYVKSASKPQTVTVVSDLTEIIEQKEVPEELVKDEEIELDQPVSLTPSGGSGSLAEAIDAMANPVESSTQVAAASRALGNRSMIRPLSGGIGGMSLDSNVSGLKGGSEMTGGDAGVMDRITQELLRQVGKNKTIVAWIMDSSASLDERREGIAKRFDRIYKELDELGVNKHEGLLSFVVSAGKSTRFLTTEPTNDTKVIRKAIRDIKDDKTGEENLFTAVRETALRLRRYQTGGRRTLVIVVLTDEIGDDIAQADETVAMLKRNKVPMYAMGPMASFARPIIHDIWQDPNSRFRVWQPIKRGPYTRREEVLHVPFEYGVYLSGFGPFAMTQITRETGGIFFIYDDDRIKSRTKYELDTLQRYKANYGTAADYTQEVAKSPFRRTLMEVVEEGNSDTVYRHQFNGHFYHWIHAKEVREELEDRAKEMAKWLNFADKALLKLGQIDKDYDRETDLRWRGNFDLNYARLLKAKVRADEYAWACADFKMSPRTLKDPKKNNGWSIKFTAEIHVGDKPGEPRAAAAPKSAATAPSAQTNIKKSNPKLAEAAKAMLEKANLHYKRVIDKHPGTPWAEAASHEINNLVGIEWVEGFDPEYAVTDEEKIARQKANKNAPKK